MGRFNDALPRIDDALAVGDARGAFATLRPWLSYPQRLEEADWTRALERFEKVGREIVGDPFADLVRAVSAHDDVQGLYDLGYELIEQELCDLAATVLARAVRKRPDLPGLLSELVSALEAEGRHTDACRWLLAAPRALESAFVLRYLLAWNTALSGDLAGARARLALVGSAAGGDEATMLERLEELLARAEAMDDVTALDGDDLRGWHFVMHGSVLLRLSPHGFKEGMRGRYALTQDSEARCREGIERLRVVLEAMGVKVPRVLRLPDRDSTILAIAASRVLDAPLEHWNAASDDPGLVVAYDLGAVGPDLLTQLQPHRPGQMLWEHASRWVSDRPLAADFVTYLYQYNTAPWAEHTLVDAATGGTLRAPPDDASPEVIAARIAALAVDDRDLGDRDALTRFAGACAKARRDGDALAGALRLQGLRPRQWTGGPVASSRFR